MGEWPSGSSSKGWIALVSTWNCSLWVQLTLLPPVIPQNISELLSSQSSTNSSHLFDKTSCSSHRCDENQANRKWEEKITRWERKEKWRSNITRGSWNVLRLPSRGRLRKPILPEGKLCTWSCFNGNSQGLWHCYLKHSNLEINCFLATKIYPKRNGKTNRVLLMPKERLPGTETGQS